MDFEDYYQRLGVSEKADSSEIKKAYRKMARKYHPDVSSEENAEDKFKEVKEAYEVLKDPQKRSEYDQLKAMGGVGSDGSYQPPPNWQSTADFSGGGYTHSDVEGFSDFFSSVFGERGGENQRQHYEQSFYSRGEDKHFKVALFIEELYRGTEKTIELRDPQLTESGHVQYKTRKLKVKIPAGLSEGQYVRLKGQGRPGLGGGDAGDLFVEVQLAPHPRYRVEGNDVFCDINLLPWEAALGGSIVLETPSGKVNLKISENSQMNQRYRLAGKGLPAKVPGDLFAEVKIVMPPNVSAEQKESYEVLAGLNTYNPRE